MTPSLTQEEFVKKVQQTNPYYEVVSQYVDARHPVSVRCKQCGKIVSRLPKSIYEGRQCVSCVSRERGLSLRKSPQIFIAEMAEMHPQIKLLSTYTRNNDAVKCRCLIDGYEWDGVPYVLLAGHGCPKCSARLQGRRTHDDFIRDMELKHPHIKVLSEFHGSSSKVDFQCDICGYQWRAVPNGLLTKESSGCPKCLRKVPVSESEFVARLEHLDTSVLYTGGYTDMAHKASFACQKCGHQWKALPPNILKRKSCPRCKKSYGEKRIATYLRQNNIAHIPEYKFEDCRNERPLPFDFYIPERNTCIEYDGQQHFEPVKFGAYDMQRAQKRLEYVRHNDALKTEYCRSNDITLVRIPYTEFDKIEEILDKLFS